MKVLLVFAAVFFSTVAFAQSPAVGVKPLAQVKPKEAVGCKLVGTVRGTRLWAGDCTSLGDQRGATSTADTLSERAAVAPPGETR
jgi:hypothetical protein